MDIKSKTHVKSKTGKSFALSEDISDMEKRQTPETREFRLGSINLEDLSGPGIFSSFSLNSLLVTDVWVSEVTVFTVQGDQTFARC